MRVQRNILGITTLVAACFLSFSAQANLNGITGRSSKQGQNCMASGCHATNPSPTAPTVTLQGPTTLEAGATGNYTLVITGGPAVKGGMNVAVSNNGGTLNAGAGLRVAAGELTHTAPKDFVNNEVRFDFSLVAPSTAGSVMMYASGNSTNGNGANTGDNAVSTQLTIQVTGGSGTPDAGTGTPDAGGGGGGDGDDEGGCGCTGAGAAPMAVLLAMVAASLRRRRS
jgi:uncharacterized protein (TIGR03382 family)